MPHTSAENRGSDTKLVGAGRRGMGAQSSLSSSALTVNSALSLRSKCLEEHLPCTSKRRRYRG